MMELDLDNLPFCGRQKELKILQDALQVASEQGKLCLVAVSGESGTGKSQLVSHFIQEHVVKSPSNNKMWACCGKYDANSLMRPYSAIGDCYSQLVEHMLQDDAEKWSAKLAENAQMDFSVLAPLIPNISKLLLPVHPVEKDTRSRGDALRRLSRVSSDSISFASENNRSASEAIQDLKEASSLHNVDRYVITLRALARLACAERTLVFVYDDIQFADPQSIRLKQRLATTAEDLRLLMIATHRPLSKDHPAAPLIRRPNSNQSTFIELKEFQHDNIRDMLQAVLKREPEDLQDLAFLVQRKTGSNPCAVQEYLRLLAHQRLLQFCTTNYRWTWDLAKMEMETDVSDDIVQMVVHRVDAICDSDDLRKLLLHAAALGDSRFESTLLFHAMNYGANRKVTTLDSMHQVLDQGCAEGLLEHQTHSTWYKFSHDRVLEAAQTFLPETGSYQREELHFGIGRQLLKMAMGEISCGGDDVNNDTVQHSKSKLFIMAMTHCNQAPGKVATLPENRCLEFVKANHMAADAALETTSFALAVGFLERGLRLLGSISVVKWNEHYDTMLALSDSLAYAYFCTDNVAAASALIEDIMTHAKSLDHKLGAYQSSILCRWQHGDLDGALKQAMAVVKEVANIRFPKRFLQVHMIKRILGIRGVLAKTSDQQLLNLPDISEKQIHTTLYFLNLLAAVASFANAEQICVMTMIASTKITLKHGYGPETVYSVASASFIMILLEDYDNGDRLAKVGMELASRNDYPVTDARAKVLLNCYCIHWKHPMHECLESLLDSANTCMKNADVSYMFFNCFIYCLMYYYCGLSLEPIETDYKRFEETLSDYGQEMFLAIMRCRMQQIQNLRGKGSRKPTDLTGDVMDQDKCIAEWKKIGHGRALFTAYLCRLELAYYFDDTHIAEEMSKLLPAIVKEGPGVWLLSRVFFQGLLCFRLAQKTRRRRRTNIAKGKRHLGWFSTRVAKGCPNCFHYMKLLTAEYTRVTVGTKDIDKVQQSYDAGIAAAGKLGFMQDHALGNELAGRFFLEEVVQKNSDKCGSGKEWAETYLTRALELYGSWGAEAKVKDMRRKYKDVLPGFDSSEIPMNGSSNRGSSRLSTTRLSFVSGSKVSRTSCASSRNSHSQTDETTTIASG